MELLGIDLTVEEFDRLMQEQTKGKELKVVNDYIIAVEPIKFSLFGVELTPEQFDRLMCEQNKGKELKVVNGAVVAVDHEATEKERLQLEMQELLVWFEEYDNQVKQYQRCVRLGILYDRDINELDNQAYENQLRIAEIRNLLQYL